MDTQTNIYFKHISANHTSNIDIEKSNNIGILMLCIIGSILCYICTKDIYKDTKFNSGYEII